MICDSDVHYSPRYFFDTMASKYPEFVFFYNELCRGRDLDQVWHKFYSQIKDASWPECQARDVFHTLPLVIRAEVKHFLADIGNPLFTVSNQLDRIILDDYRNYCPDLQGYLDSFALTHTDRQSLTCYASFMMMFYQTDKEFAVDLMHHWHRESRALVQTHPGKFDAVGWLALQDSEASLRELDKIIDQGFFAVQLHDHVLWSFMPDHWHVFEICAKHQMPVYLHPTKYNPYPLPWQWTINTNYVNLRQIWSYPTDFWKIGIAGMITEGLLDRFPDIKLIVAEHGLEWVEPMRAAMKEAGFPDPLPYFQNNFHFTVEPEEPHFLQNANTMGWDRLLFATDYPHNDPGGSHRFNDVDLLEKFQDTNRISQHQFDMLTHKNYLSLLR